jgi:lipopolysaccharide export system protein LptA
MRLTIERLRTLVLVAGVLLVIALGVFLGRAKFHYRFNKKDLPHSLGLNIQEEANGFVYTHEVRGHVLYKIRASKQAQLKKDGKIFIQLHDVMIELYAEDGSRVDRIEGNEFEYNPKSGIAKAVGPVEITLMKPTVAPAIAPKAKADRALGSKQMPGTLASAAQNAASGEIHVKTSGLVFDRNSGEASTAEKVEFSLKEGDGSAVGAKFDGHEGLLVLERDVELSIQRGAEPVKLSAKQATFNRDEQNCLLSGATVRLGDDTARAEEAKLHFRDDGSAELLNATGGFSLTTRKGGHVAAPTGVLAFDEHNQPLRGHLQGGVTIDSESEGRKIHGNSPVMDLVFAGKGILKSAHLERGVQIASDEQASPQEGALRSHREWMSPVLDIAFRDAGNDRVEPASMHGTGGVVVTGSTQRGNAPAAPEKLTADEVTGEFGPHGALRLMTGRGHTTMTEVSAAGVQQSMSGDLLVAHLASAESVAAKKASQGGMQIESATVDGNVVLIQQPPAKNGVAQPEVRARANHGEYANSGQWLHLTGNPRVTDGGLEITADKLNVSQQSGDALAQGNVKGTWAGDGRPESNAGALKADFGAQGPLHFVAKEAELRRSDGAAVFRGDARLWQQGNSVAAPEIALNRGQQTLKAQTGSAKTPVQVVLVSATATLPGPKENPKQKGPSVIRMRGGDLKYSGAERKAVMRAGVTGRVVATTADAETTSTEVELTLLPAGNHAGKDGAAAQVDRMVSTGHVEISSQGRRGVGEQLVFTNESGNYVLTGTPAAPPQLIDPARGTVTGQALIFNTRDDSVSIEGEGQKTTTATTVPK